jgi:hypothetical protein
MPIRTLHGFNNMIKVCYISNKKFFSTEPGEIKNKISERAMYDELVGYMFDIPDIC